MLIRYCVHAYLQYAFVHKLIKDGSKFVGLDVLAY